MIVQFWQVSLLSWNYQQMLSASFGQVGSGIQLEKVGPLLFQIVLLCLKN